MEIDRYNYSSYSKRELWDEIDSARTSARRAGNVLAFIWAAVWIYLYRNELIEILTALGGIRG